MIVIFGTMYLVKKMRTNMTQHIGGMLTKKRGFNIKL